MGRKCVYLGLSVSTDVEIWCDIRHVKEILETLHNPKLIKKTRRILTLMSRKLYDPDLYQRYISLPGIGVAAMKWKGGNNIRIYCQEKYSEPKQIILATSPFSKKSQALTRAHESKIESILKLEYQFLEKI